MNPAATIPSPVDPVPYTAQVETYFPNSRVASDGEWVSPLTQGGPDGSLERIPNELVGPVNAVWEKPRDSEEQGLGRSPGFTWPWQFHVDAFNLDSLSIMGFETFIDANMQPDRQGWSIPTYYEQFQGAGEEYGAVSIDDANSLAYTYGYGSVVSS